MSDPSSIRIYGLDFTSAPSKRKPITCATCTLHGSHLTLEDVFPIVSFNEFEAWLHQPGPWLAALDFPFGQPRQLLTRLGWPLTWESYVGLVGTMDKATFEKTLQDYQDGRPSGEKQHMRVTDTLAGSRSPMMLHRVPVGKMFFQGAPRLLASGVSVLPSHPQPTTRIVMEGYPALAARRWSGKQSYKSDERAKQTVEQHATRQRIVDGIRSSALEEIYGIQLCLTDEQVQRLVEEPMGDELDAVLCVIQAAWAYTRRDANYGIPTTCDVVEGWIVDPSLHPLAP